MPLDPITTIGQTITVSTLDELQDAYAQLSTQPGGGTILLESGEYGIFSIYPYGTTDGDQPVVIASAVSEDPARFDGIWLKEVENIRIEDVVVDSTGTDLGAYKFDLMLSSVTNVQIADSQFLHDSDNALKDAGEIVESMSLIRDSSGVLLEGNYIDGYLHAIQVLEADTLEIVDNELTNMQGDGFRGGGMQNLLIQENYFHGFYGVDQTVTHTDLIQIWGTAAQTLTENVTITENILITSGAASQSIFIRNEEIGSSDEPTSGYFQNFTITNNLIYNSHLWGIHLGDTQGAVIDNNTLLYNPDATMEVNGEPHSYAPEIRARNSYDVTANDNIAAAVTLDNGGTAEGNQIVQNSDLTLSSYSGNHFVNPLAGEKVTLEDLYMLSSSPWYGEAGSSLGVFLDDTSDGVQGVIKAISDPDDSYVMTYDASLSTDGAGATIDNPAYTYHWTFADGTTAEGVSVTKLYDDGGFKGATLEVRLDGETVASVTRNFNVETKDIFAFDFEDGVVDISAGSPEVIDNGTATASHDGTGFLIGDGNKLELGRGTDGLYEMDSFGLAVDLQPTGDEQTGVFLHLYQTMTGEVLEDGSVKFSMTTNEGNYSMVSRDPVFEEGEMHRIGIAFDGKTGQMEMFVDGESVSSTEAWGATPPPVYFSLIFGNTWHDSMDAIVDNIAMSADPAVAGDLPDVTPPVKEPPVGDPPPVEDPPAEDSPAEDPPAEEPPADHPGGRGDAPEAVPDGGSSFFLADLLDIILSIFGLGRGDDPAPASTVETAERAEVMLSDVLPVTEALDEEMPTEEDEEVEVDLAA